MGLEGAGRGQGIGLEIERVEEKRRGEERVGWLGEDVGVGVDVDVERKK